MQRGRCDWGMDAARPVEVGGYLTQACIGQSVSDVSLDIMPIHDSVPRCARRLQLRQYADMSDNCSQLAPGACDEVWKVLFGIQEHIKSYAKRKGSVRARHLHLRWQSAETGNLRNLPFYSQAHSRCRQYTTSEAVRTRILRHAVQNTRASLFRIECCSRNGGRQIVPCWVGCHA